MFKRVKVNVSARDIALKYGLKQGKNGLFLCPFHPDKNPSMKAERNFYCFGCGEKGDSIRLAEKIFGIPALEAAYTIADEYGIDVSDCVSEKQKTDYAKGKLKSIPELEYELLTVDRLEKGRTQYFNSFTLTVTGNVM